ncbi:MAG: calcium/sodium antiporter [Marinilabiliaceae bacterium]|nr:calcium/sodium antiporter [Marinilabiliaceae bacterium]
MVINLILLTAGFVLLIMGANGLVEGASSVAKKYKVSELAIGLTIVAFGTSAPELVVNVMASIDGHSTIVYSNVIGSNLFNLFLILGITGVITPIVVQSSTVWKEIPFSLFTILVLLLLANERLFSGSQELNGVDGMLLLFLFVFFMFYVYFQLKQDPAETHVEENPFNTFRSWLFIGLGLAGLVFGARLVVANAVKLATLLEISEKVIGLTVVAAGTSLPELVTSVVAALKNKNDIAVGNIIGSNVFNILLVLGLSSVIAPIPYDSLFNIDLSLLSIGTIILFIAMFTGGRRKLDRWEAGILVVVYVAYLLRLLVS